MNVHKSSRQRGLTLIELSITISIITGLTSMLFVSAEYYKNSSDRAACISQLASIQKAMRSHQNMNGLSSGDAITSGDLIGAGKAIPNTPRCPKSGTAIIMQGIVPAPGVIYAECSEYDNSNGTLDVSQDHTSSQFFGL